MNTALTLAKRVFLLFYRDKGNIVFSILGSLIMFAIYFLFLGDTYKHAWYSRDSFSPICSRSL